MVTVVQVTLVRVGDTAGFPIPVASATIIGQYQVTATTGTQTSNFATPAVWHGCIWRVALDGDVSCKLLEGTNGQAATNGFLCPAPGVYEFAATGPGKYMNFLSTA